MRARAISALVLFSVSMAVVLFVAMLPGMEVVTTAGGTALAVVVLALSVPLVDSAVFGSSVRPETAGVVLGVPTGFLVRQAQEAPALAAGAGRVAVLAMVLSAVLLGVRVYRNRQRA